METVAVVGLGYVGLPLAVALARHMPTVGFDPNEAKVEHYRRHHDPTGEVSEEELRAATQLSCTSDPAALAAADYLIVAVPTPIDAAHQPDFGPLIAASRTVGAHMKGGATVIYESTVYPGATEEVCVPILEEQSGLRWKDGFFIAYSPERINPGDKQHRLQTIVKVVAGDTERTLERVAALYERVVDAGVHRASSIQVAEAAKVIENTQRDLNIALMNELAIIFNRLGLDTLEILEAAGSKWNFLPFRPGLVGGHCIGVDPYYLTRKAEMVGYHPQVILAGRRINDGMGKYVTEQVIKQIIASGHCVKDSRVAVLGLTFKENCPDTRNSRSVDVVRELESYGVHVLCHDPLADSEEALHEYGIAMVPWDALRDLHAIVVTVAHAPFLERSAEDYRAMAREQASFIDVKSAFDRNALERAGLAVWRL